MYPRSLDTDTPDFVLAIFISLLVLVSIATVPISGAAAQSDFSVSLDAPRTTTAGDKATISASVSVPDLAGDYERDGTVTLYVDGEQVDQQTVTVSDGETTEVSFTHTFDNSGTATIEVEGTVTLAGQSFSDSASTTIEVEEPEQELSIDGDLSVSLETPSTPEVDTETTTTVSSDIPTYSGTDSAELVLRLLVDGEEVASKTVSVKSGESTETDFTTVFDSSGETKITVEANLNVADRTLSKSISRSITVLDATPEDVPSEAATIEGAAFTVPESLQDEVEAYRNSVSTDLQANAFIIAHQDTLYLVFSRSEPQKGIANAEGAVLDQDLSTENLTFSVMVATSTTFETTGTQTTVKDVADNSENYELDLVRITSNYRRIATLTDPDSGEDYTLSSTSGILIDNPTTEVSLFQNIGSKTRTLSRDSSTEQIDTMLNDPRGPHLHTFAFETKFWMDAEATVDAIVLDPQSAARRFIDEYDQAGIAHAEDGEPILYVVDEELQPRSMDDVASIKSQADSLDGEVVRVETRLYQETVSVQETLEHNTGCSEDVLEVQTPQGPVCMNVVQDVLIQSGAAWSTVPQSRDDVLLVVGASSRHLDEPQTFEEGRYQITGEVVSTSRINESLPEGAVLIIYDLERLGDIDYDGVKEESKAIIEGQTKQLADNLRAQMDSSDTQLPTGSVKESVQSVKSGEASEVNFDMSEQGSVAVERISLNASKNLENVRVEVSEAMALLRSVGAPPGTVVRLLNVSVSASNDDIDGATIRLRIARSAIPEGAELGVHRYHDGEWESLSSSVVERSESKLVLEVETSGFSYFAVSTTEEETDKQSATDGPQSDSTETQSQDDNNTTEQDSVFGVETPGFSMGSAVLAVVILLFIWVRK